MPTLWEAMVLSDSMACPSLLENAAACDVDGSDDLGVSALVMEVLGISFKLVCFGPRECLCSKFCGCHG